MTVVLSPIPKIRFTDSNGDALVGGKLFTYAAGGTTKINTYTDSTGLSANTNPIILDSRGECSCWLTAGTAYKLTLAPSTDSDPPVAAYWAIDNITEQATPTLTSLGGAASTLILTAGAGLSGGGDLSANRTFSLNVGNANTWTAAQRGAVVILTDASTVTPDFSAGNNFSILTTSGVGASRTVANPTNIVAGQSGVLTVIQDSPGSRTITWGSYFKFQAGTPPTLSTGANAIDDLAYYVRSTTAIDVLLAIKGAA